MVSERALNRVETSVLAPDGVRAVNTEGLPDDRLKSNLIKSVPCRIILYGVAFTNPERKVF